MPLNSKHFIFQKENSLKENQIIKVKNLKVNFKVKNGLLQAVRGVDLSIYKGQIIGIVGESGSGKSVSVKSLIGFNENSITSAEILNLSNLDLLKIKKNTWNYVRGTYISYIPQDPLTSLNPTKKIGKQIVEAIFISEKRRFEQKKANLKEKLKFGEISKEEFEKNINNIKNEYKKNTNKKNAWNRVKEILKFIGIEDVEKRIKSYPHVFSGGMRQRIVIAIAIASRPDVIIADEPTTALDVTVQAKVLSLIKKLRDEFGITIVFISHNIALVANFCDYIYVMYAGKIVEQGTSEEIFTNPLHPYTWALIESIPDDINETKLKPIPGSPPNLTSPPKGDAFALRNKYAIELDFKKQPPLFAVSKTHKAATWLLHPDFPNQIEIPKNVLNKIELSKSSFEILKKQKQSNKNFEMKKNKIKTSALNLKDKKAVNNEKK